jgi:hypothetical protein
MFMMKKVLTILISAFLLASGMQVTLARHYCGGTLAGTRISITGKLASCGMEKPESSCPDHQVFNKKCCEDSVCFFSISSNYFPEYFKLTYHTSTRSTVPLLTGNIIADNSYNPDLIIRVFPPGKHLKPRLSQSEICVFRI